MAEITNVSMVTRELKGDEETIDDPNALSTREVPPHVEVFEVNGAFFFGMIDRFQNSLRSIEKAPKVLIVRIRNVLAIDASAIQALRELSKSCKKDKMTLIFSGVHSQPLMAFEKTGFLEEVGSENMCATIDEALDRARGVLGLTEKASAPSGPDS
jgi:SulP family sulfate permease